MPLANRFALSIGLSIVILPLGAFWLNLTVGLPLTTTTLLLLGLGLSMLPPAYHLTKRNRN
jgi:uncharacterized membrane protein